MWAEGPLDVGPGFETQGPTLGGILRSFFAFLAHRAPGALQSRALFGTDAGLRAQHGVEMGNRIPLFSGFGHLGVPPVVFIIVQAIGGIGSGTAFLTQNSALSTPSRMVRGVQARVCTMVAT